jgi:hypothetical protein
VSARDRDAEGRPRNARPRDRLGRPLPRGSAGDGPQDDPIASAPADPVELLAATQALLDSGRPFEAHELLELQWKRAPEAERELWRALAQLAVAVTHELRGNAAGASALAQRSAAGLASYDRRPERALPYRVDVAGLIAYASRLAAGEAGTTTPRLTS